MSLPKSCIFCLLSVWCSNSDDILPLSSAAFISMRPEREKKINSNRSAYLLIFFLSSQKPSVKGCVLTLSFILAESVVMGMVLYTLAFQAESVPGRWKLKLPTK